MEPGDISLTDLESLSQEVLALSTLRNAIVKEYEEKRDALDAIFSKMGFGQQTVKDKNGNVFGNITRPSLTTKVEIDKPYVMLDWLKKRKPGEIIQRPWINPGYWKILEDASRRAGVGIDPETNEVLDWIKVTTVENTIRPTATREAKNAVAKLLREGKLLELPMGSDE